MSLYGNPTTEAPPAMGPMPPDRQPQTLGELLRAALAMIGRDEQLTPDEMQDVMAFMQGVQMIGRGRASRGEPGADGLAAQQAMMPPQAPGGEVGDYGTGLGGQDKFQGGQ